MHNKEKTIKDINELLQDFSISELIAIFNAIKKLKSFKSV